MPQDRLRSLLAEGDRRSTGRVNEVISLVETSSYLVSSLLDCLSDGDACVRMRAADAAEKLSRKQPSWFQPFKTSLLRLLADATQPELRWHLAVMVPRLQLNPAECSRVFTLLQNYLTDRSSIVKTCSMQGLADLTKQDASLRPEVTALVQFLSLNGTAAMRARGRILLKTILPQTMLVPATPKARHSERNSQPAAKLKAK